MILFTVIPSRDMNPSSYNTSSSNNQQSPRQSGYSPSQGYSAMFSQNSSNSHQYANPQSYSSHAYQQMYGQPYGQHTGHLSHQGHQSASPHQQHYGSSVGLQGGQFGSGGPMMGANDYGMHGGHPGYTHVQPSHAGGYGTHFSMPGGMQHLQQGQQGLMMPGAHMQGVGQNPVALHGGNAVGQAPKSGRGKKGAAAPAEKSGRGRKPKKADAAVAGKVPKGGKIPKGKAGDRHHPYGGKTKGDKDAEKEKKKKKDAPKPVLRSHLKPPKQAPSAWQVYFTEELQKMKADQPGERLNVAHVAKDAGQRYAALPEEKKKEFQRKSLEAKAQWEKEMEDWRQTLTPEDIKQENMYRTAQRKAGKSRKGNLKDPNAPKKPLSAYFLFLRAIRADPALTQSVFEGEQETTKQSVLAASKWRALPEAEKQPYLEKAEADKAEYERLRREYEAAVAIRLLVVVLVGVEQKRIGGE
jgi:hypothetical protein